MKTFRRKKCLQLICGLLTLCMVAALIPHAARAADTGRTITLEAGKVDMLRVLDGAQDGDTIVLNGLVTVTDMSSKDAPWVINKAVTIQGGILLLRAGGIILDADVTFRNTILSFDSFIRNGIMANGHTLTLENVDCDTSAKSVNLFCGGLYDPDGYGSTPGTEGKIILRGNISLKGDSAPGNLYGGNLCMGGLNEADSAINGPANQYDGNASILIESSDAELGSIYGGGAQQRIPVGSASGKVILTDPAKYTTGGRVDIRLQDGTVKNVDGAGADDVHVAYNGTAYSANLTVKNVSSLTVETGSVMPAAESGLNERMALSVREGATLDLTSLENVTVGSFSGGGTLVLDQSQSLSVTGSVTGRTAIGIASLNASGSSTMPPIEGHPYIHASQSGADAFHLASPDGSDTRLTRDENGDWSVPASDAPVLVENFWFVDAYSSVASGEFAELPLNITNVENGADTPLLDFIPLTIIVDDCPANRQMDGEGYYVYTTADNKLSIEVIYDTVCVAGADGTYSIEVVIPTTNTSDGRILSAQTVLTIGAGTAPVESFAYRIRSVSADDAQVVADIAAQGADTGVSATVFAAAYTQDGRMCGVSAVSITGAGTVTVPLDSSGADYVTVFIVDGMSSMKPVCRKQSVVKNGQLV